MKQVLVVEAETPIQETLVEALKAEGHGVITASGSHAASNLFQSLNFTQGKLPFDLIIYDWMLPEVDDLELCRWLRHQDNFMPILILSVNESEANRISAIEAGADGYLLKPFSRQELIVRCRSLLRRHYLGRSPEPIVLQFQEVSLHQQEHRVLVRGKEVKLKPKEYRLLELFLKFPRRTWSRQELLEQVWENDLADKTKTLDVHIRWLREKLEIRPSRPKYIVTVPKVGYRFG